MIEMNKFEHLAMALMQEHEVYIKVDTVTPSYHNENVVTYMVRYGDFTSELVFDKNTPLYEQAEWLEKRIMRAKELVKNGADESELALIGWDK